MHRNRSILLYIIIWTVIVAPLSIWGAKKLKENYGYCLYEGCGAKLENKYQEYCEPHNDKVWEEKRKERQEKDDIEEDYYTPSPTETPSPTPYRRRNYSGSYGNVYPNDPSEYSDYEDFYYDNEEDFDDLDEAEDYYNENGGEW